MKKKNPLTLAHVQKVHFALLTCLSHFVAACVVQPEHRRFIAANIWSRWRLDPAPHPLFPRFLSALPHLPSPFCGKHFSRRWCTWLTLNTLLISVLRVSVCCNSRMTTNMWKTKTHERWGKKRSGRRRKNGNPEALECRVQLQFGISLGSISSALIGLTLLIPPDVQH